MGTCISQRQKNSQKNQLCPVDQLTFFLENKEFYLNEERVHSHEYPDIIHDAKQISTSKPTNYFHIESQLGQGQYGKVFLVSQKSCSKRRFALKEIILKSMYGLKEVLHEAVLLRECDHPNIIKFYQILRQGYNVYYQLEFCKGKILSAYINEQKTFNENKIKIIFRQVLKSIQYIHSKGICHRDIKPDNFKFGAKDDLHSLKLLDFGFACKYFRKGAKNRFYYTIGSPVYSAPEVFTGNYDQKCDLWSAGVLFYELVTGKVPFGLRQTRLEFYEEVFKDSIDYFFPFKSLDLDDNFFDLLKGLLCIDPMERLTVNQALAHSWFGETKKPDLKPLEIKEMLGNFVKFAECNSFHQNIMKFHVKNLEKKDTAKEVELFESIDRNQDGVITLRDLRYFLVKNKLDLENKEFLDFTKTQKKMNVIKFKYLDFVSSVFDKNHLSSESGLKFIFKSIKQNYSHKIKVSDLHNAYNQINCKFGVKKFEIFCSLINPEINLKKGLTFEQFGSIMSMGSKSHFFFDEKTLHKDMSMMSTMEELPK